MYSGYRVDFYDSEWKLDENVPIELPKFNLNGWQWGITFGSEFGGERRKQNQSEKKEKKG